MAWTLLAPYLHSCPSNNTRIEWQNFPALTIINQPNGIEFFKPAITTNGRVLSAPGRVIELTWEVPGKAVGPDLSYKTSTSAGKPKYAAFISQVAVLYAPLDNLKHNYASVVQPGGLLFPYDPIINGTSFIVIVDDNPVLSPYNLSLLNDHIVAGPALYQSG